MIYAQKLLDPGWPISDINRYLELAVMGWNTAILQKPERIKAIEKYIAENQCSSVKLGPDCYDTLELIVALAHLKKALFPASRNTFKSAKWSPSGKTITSIRNQEN